MTNSKFKRVLSLVLAFVMTASLFTNWPMPVFATSGTDTIKLDFVPENGVPEIDGLYKPGTIRNDSIRLYESTDYGATGVEVSGVQGVTVTVLTSHTINGVKMYEIDCTQEANEEIFNLILDYSFVSSTDIMLEGEESLPAPTPYPAIIPSSAINEAYNSLLATTTSAEYDSIYAGTSADVIGKFSAEQKDAVELHRAVLVAYETLMATETVASYDSIYTTCDPNVLNAFTDVQKAAIAAHRAEMYDAENPDTGIYLELPEGAIAQAGTPSGALAAVNGTSLVAYKSLDNGAMGVEIPVNAGTVVELITSYTFSNSDLVFYRYDYSGSNEELKDASTGETYGYVFIPASAVTITNEVGTNSYTNEEYGITVSGQIPTGLTLNVVPEDVNGVLADAGALMGGSDWTYDVDLTYPGGEYKTTQGIDVTFDKENVQMPVGANYKAYHIKNDNTVEVLGPFVYDGNDIEVTFNGLSPVGISANVININSRPFEKAVFKNSTVKVYPSDKDNAEPITLTGLTDTDFFTLSGYAPYGYKMSSGEERYYIDWYNGSNTTIAGILNVGSRYLVDINDIEEYVESTPTPTPEPEQPEEVVEAYENLIKAPTLSDFEEVIFGCMDSGYFEQFTDAQLSEIERISGILEEMDAATEDLTDFGFEGTVTVEGAKLYLNPITWPEEYVVVNTIIVTDVEIEGIMAEYSSVEGDYSDEYYIIDTSGWAAFEGKTPYKYIHKDDFAFEGNWTKVDGKGYFLSDEIKIYDNTGKTYRRITDGLSKGAFDVLYSFFTNNGDGTVTDWYVINTTGWTDVNGSTIRNRLVKRSDVNLITSETINAAYNNMLAAATVSKFDSLYNAAQASGIIDCLTDTQKQDLADTRTVLAGMAEATIDLSQYELPATFANEETKLYPNPVTQPDKYITAVVKEEQSLLANMLSILPLFLTAHAAEEEVTAQEIIIIGKYLADDGTLYYILDVSGWEGLDGIETIYVKASEIEIQVDNSTKEIYISLLSAQAGEELAEILAGLDENTVAVMTEAGLIDLAENHAEVLEFLAENGTTPIADESVIGMYGQPVGGTQTIYIYADPDVMTKGMTYYDLPSDEFKTPFKIVDVMIDERDTAVYYKMNYSYASKPNAGTEPCSWIRADAVELLPDYIDPTETLYLKLMQTETLEEWFELLESLTDQQLQLFDEMDEEMLAALTEHFDGLPCAIDKEKADFMAELLSAETVAEYLAIKAEMSEQTEILLSGTDYIAMHDRITALADAEDTSPEGVVDYTNSAPMVIPDYTEIQEATVYNMKNRMLMAVPADESEPSPSPSVSPTATPEGTDTANPPIKDTDGVVTTKTVTSIGGGKYTVKLETYVTGAKVTTAVEKQIPTDIIIVVDQSGSMQFDMDKSTTYDRIVGTAEEIYNNDSYADKVYVNVGTSANPVYRKVTMSAETGDSYVSANSLGYNTNSELYSNRANLYYKETESSEPVKVTVSQGNNYRYTYSIPSGSLNNTNENSWNRSPSFLGKLYIKTDDITKVTFTYTDADNNKVEKEYLPTDSVPKDSDNIVGNTYYYQNTTTSEHRLDALVRALNNFAASVEEKAKGNDGVWGPNPAKDNVNDDVNHRIAIVGFSSSVNTYHNTEILTGCDISTGGSHSTEYGVYYPLGVEKNGVQYDGTGYTAATGTALVSMDTTAGQTSVENAIKALTAHGGTQTNHGLDMAADILTAEANKGTVYTKTENGVTTTVRNKIVILFTDGSPTSSSGFETNVANSAISYAKTIKNTHNATLYGVGIFDDADARVLTNADKTNAYLPSGLINENKFMHFVSSNFKNAENMSTSYDTNGNNNYYNTETFHKDADGKYTGKSYYLSASNSDALNNIFQTISEESVTNANVVELDETTVIKDIVAPNFSVPANATSVTVSKAKLTSIDAKGEYVFAAPESTGLSATLSDYDGDGVKDSVDVTGFDFADNWVGSETAANGTVTYRGYKLIINFDIPVDSDFMGGNKVKTNGNNSGVYGGDGTLVENFERPTQNITLKNITATWQNQYIYRTNNADIKALFLAAKVNGKDAATVINGENNAYVKIAFTITGGGETLATYTIPAGKDFANGGWDDESALTPALTADTPYTLSWTITPIYDGPIQPVGGSATAKVFVYDPVLTFKDSTGYYGGSVPALNDVNNRVAETAATVNKTEWVNANEEPFVQAQMYGREPILVTTYTAGTGASNGVIVTTNDIPVNVTVKVGDTDVTDIVEFKHQDCAGVTDDEPMPVFAGTGDETDYAELVVHVKTAQLIINKTVDPNGAPTIPTDSFGFIVNQNVSPELSATEDNFKPYYVYEVFTKGVNGAADKSEGILVMFAGDKLYLTHNQYAVITGMPIGTYAVTEDLQGNAKLKYDTTATGGTFDKAALAVTNTFTENPLVVGGNVEFTNKLNTGSITITKKVEMPSGFPMPTEKFAIKVAKTDGTYEKTVNLANGESVTLDNLVIGDYTVTEARQILYTTTYTPAQNVKVNPGKDTAVTVENARKLADLEIKKTVVTPAGIDKTGEEFAFKAYITGAVEGETLKVGDQAVTILKDAKGTYIPLTLKHDQSAVVKNLPITTAFEIVETAVAGYTTTVNTANIAPTNTVTGTLPQTGLTGDNAVVFTNTLDTGSLEINKTVISAPGVAIPTEGFTFTVDVNNVSANDAIAYTINGEKQTPAVVDANGNVTITLAHGQTAVLTGLPTGAVVVTETAKDQFTTKVNGADGTVFNGEIVKDTKETVVYVNTMKTYSLTINKAFATGTSPEVGETFVFTVTRPGGFSQQVVIAVTDKNNDSVVEYAPVTITNLPAGEYTVTEDMSWSKQYTATYSPSQTVVITNADQSVTVTNSKTDKWLKADAYAENKFASYGTAGGVVVENGTAILGDDNNA
ncbi:MAG: VWA domain-containing protein [Oscillospiraceae bacterium]|nr:VWA domain-containing protein [Oscillospiraceae bacterium]